MIYKLEPVTLIRTDFECIIQQSASSASMGKNDQYYAVARGRQVGIYRNWNDCKTQIDGFQNARYKKFVNEAEARKFIAENLSVPGKKLPTSTDMPASSTEVTRKRKFEGTKRCSPVKKTRLEETVTDPEFIDAPVVYTDGACSSNGTNRARAGWGVYWGDDSPDNEYGAVYGAPTNNRGELIAVEKALEKVRSE
ncbi:CRE-RNH-1.0 protein [Caenorhabditis remanei]|uniref:ribonuclease H n=1 Tax=Caenorhabditis remanei TaxID=31234 RepID=E3M4A1_CAERE|nr:CRE-RNH-1.0 protein [Caenorhabditis remanei]